MHSTCPVSPFTLPKDKGAERCGHLSATQYAFPDKSLQSTRGSPNKDVPIGADAAAPTCPTLAFGRSLLRPMAYHWFRTSTGKWEWSKLLSEVPLVVEPAGSNGSLHSGIARYQGLKLKTTTELSRRIVWDFSMSWASRNHTFSTTPSLSCRKSVRLELDWWIPCHDPHKRATKTCKNYMLDDWRQCLFSVQSKSGCHAKSIQKSIYLTSNNWGNICTNSAGNAAHRLIHSSLTRSYEIPMESKGFQSQLSGAQQQRPSPSIG